jgi:tetratricopeptide (TPR) repeat protein
MWFGPSAAHADGCQTAYGVAPDLVIRECNEALSRAPNADYYRIRGEAYFAKKEYDRAVADYNEFLKLDPYDPFSFGRRGEIYGEMKDYDRAIADYSEAIKLRPNNAYFYGSRARLYQNRKDYDRAIADYSAAIVSTLGGKDSTNSYGADFYYLERARLYETMKDHDRAIADASEAIKLKPNYPWAYSVRAENYWQKDHSDDSDVDHAIADYSEAIRLRPNDAENFAWRSFMYQLKRDGDRAFADCSEAIKLNPTGTWGVCSDAYVVHANGYYLNRDYDHAIVDCNAAYKINTPSGNLLNHCGDAYRARGYEYVNQRDDDAISDFNEAIKLYAKDSVAYRGRGTAYLNKGYYDRAIADFDEAIRLGKGKGLVDFMHRGRAWEAKRDRSKAIEDYAKALALPVNEWTTLDTVDQQRDAQAEARQRLAALQGAVSQPPSPSLPPQPSVAIGRRVALVIGNSAYRLGPLQNPTSDAAAVAETLAKLGFNKVILKRDLTLDGFRAALREFSHETAGADLGLVFFAGHGIEVKGRNFLVPVDATLARETDIDLEAITLDTVVAQLEGARKLKLVILDACRNNPFPAGQRGGPRGLRRVEPEDNTLVVYAAKDGTTADEHLGDSGVEIRQMFGAVRDEVMALTGRAQQPYTYGTLGGQALYLSAQQ